MTCQETSIPFVHPVYVRSIVDCLNGRGVPASQVLTNAGLDWQDLSDDGALIDFSVFRRFVMHAVRASGEPALGVLSGAMLQPYHSPLGMAAVTSGTLGQGLSFLSRHASLIFRGMHFRLDDDGRRSTLRIRPVRPICDTHVFVMQSMVGAHCRILEAMLGRPADELAVGLPYPRPAGVDEPCLRYVRSVVYDQPCLWFGLPASLLAAPPPSADAKAFALASKACLRMESELGQAGFVERVRQVLLEHLPSNPDIHTLAPELGVSLRTLMRRLADAELSFSGIKNDLRRTHAAWYLRNTQMSIEDIALQLGYNDHTNFSRKFKDWYRVPPSKMRQAFRTSPH
ncbi:AraC family transcriptional regulator [Variovorax sp. J22P168]|uniref:AraC family transcriptional regulator n=1 Tax=Variovorax jilinensis TaxID=3053513 RepID=UPI00257809AE|nr:AraC family transcriptional regulator [Variovorax sp. J22P168]MDM0014788.1 AraC family transcriptional regulator [Variovorax sp. J22P168]